MNARPKVLIVAPFEAFPGEPGGSKRFVHIARMLSRNADVTLVASRFYHFTKSQRTSVPTIDGVSIVLLDQPAYSLNVGMGRIFSQWVFCRNLKKYIANHFDADVVYSAYPLIQSNIILGEYKKKNGFKLVIDVIDVWPESIKGPLPVFDSKLGKALMSPYSRRADAAYASADALVAVSETYAQRANVKAFALDKCVVAYLGTDNLLYKQRNTARSEQDDSVIAIYLGTLGGSYDLETLVRAAALVPHVKVRIVGTGPSYKLLKNLNEKLGSPVEFYGAVEYERATQLLLESDIAVNPIKKAAEQSVTYKLSDYVSAGMPIVSCQKNAEVMQMLERGGGVMYEPGNERELAAALSRLASDVSLRESMSRSNREIAENLFHRPNTYRKIENLVFSMCDA